MSLVVGIAWMAWRGGWIGLAPGDVPVQLTFGLLMLPVMFVAAVLVQRRLSARRGSARVPASGADIAVQSGFYVVNAAVEEAFFRGLVQGGLGALGLTPVGLAIGTAAYVLYHRLGGWAWPDVMATALVGVPLGVAYWLLPGPPSLLGVAIAHAGATCGFLGPGPWLLRRFGLLS